MTHYYVYYRVDPARLEVLRRSIERVFAVIEQATGVRGRWMHRRDDPTTFMEVFENVADASAFEALLERETAGLGLERHTESFVCA